MKYKKKVPSILSILFTMMLMLSYQNAKALTFVLDFTSINTTETIFGSGNGFTSDDLDVTAFGFSSGDFNTITSGILAGVINDFLGYPTVNANGSSPIPVNQQLDIDFVIGSVFNAPSNGDSDYFFMKVGEISASNIPSTTNILGHACSSCVRSSTGSGPSVSNASLIGTILTDNIVGIPALGNLTEVLNSLIGTISHEIGHTLSLDHSGMVANPGESSFSLMGTATSGMPNAERLVDRAFSYSDMGTLIAAIGLRDIDNSATVPSPTTLYLFVFGLIALGLTSKKNRYSQAM